MARGYPDFEGNKSKMWSSLDWAAREGVDTNLSGVSGAVAANVIVQIVTYVVPAGFTLLVAYIGAEVIGQVGNLIIRLGDITTGVMLLRTGGVQGTHVVLNKIVPIPPGHTVDLLGVHFGAALGQLGGHIGGYLI